MMIKTNSSLVTEMLKESRLPLLTRARYYLPEHDVYGLMKEGTVGDDITVRYFHIYYDNVRASQEKNEYLKQLIKKSTCRKRWMKRSEGKRMWCHMKSCSN